VTELLGLVLFGSRARGDHVEDSDVDLLALVSDGAPAFVTRPGITVSCYPLDQVLRRARSGDLFALHVVAEGKVVYEREPVFARVQRAFCYRSDYEREIRMAANVGWFLLHHCDPAVDGVRFNGRVSWCTHTLIVARAATQRQPVFSATGLGAFADSNAVALLIRSKHRPTVDPALLEMFRSVLKEFGGPEPPALATLAAEGRRFEAVKNPAGVVAVRAMIASRGGSANRNDSGGAAHDHS
jgi:predicted nucleotidyltransferase